MKVRYDIVVSVVTVLAVVQFLFCATAHSVRRGFSKGEKMPEFSATDLAGQVFSYKHGGKKALMVVFLSVGQKESARAAADIEEITKKLGADAEHLEVVVAVDDPNCDAYFHSKKEGPAKNFHLLLDREYKLWGTFGIIATPTVIIAGMDDKLAWVKAGHGYNFIPLVRAHLNQALGIAQDLDLNDANRVKTLTNATITARIKRHLQMAKILQQKGELESAIQQVNKAKELDPNSMEVALQMGELLCRAGKSKAAVEVVGTLKATKRLDKARLLLISGWARRQMGDLDEAEKLLLESVMLNPISSRGLFELGKVYQAKGNVEKAMQAYYRALVHIFAEPAEADFLTNRNKKL